MANTDWVKATRIWSALHDGVAARRARLLPGLSRRARTARRSSTSWSTPRPSRRQELLEKYPWPARSPNGQINVASMLDINKWFVDNKLSTQAVPGRAPCQFEPTSIRQPEARPVRAAEQGQQAAGLPGLMTAPAGRRVMVAAARRSGRDRGPAQRIRSAGRAASSPSIMSISALRRASSFASSARAVAGNRRCCASSPASTSRPPAPSRSTPPAGRSRTPWCSRTAGCFPG